MQAIVLEQPFTFRAATVESPPEPAAGEALVRVLRIGICGTDLHAFHGRQPFFSYPRVLGHELAVEVLRVGDAVAGLSPGDRCAVEPYVNCGRCIACRRGKSNCCVELAVLGVHKNGGLCEYLTVPTRLLHRSTTLSVDQLALIEPLGIGAHAVSRAALTPGEWALVIGAGPIGLATAQFALAAGAAVIVSDVNERRLAFARTHLGIQHCLVAQQNPLEQIAAITSSDLPTAVFDCTGSARSMMDSFQYVAHGGRLIFVGLVQADLSFHDPHFHRREITLLASRNATSADFQRVISLLDSGHINVSPWITHRCSFDALIDEFPRWAQPETGVIKGLVEM
jgi:2-desacetyl-2-hydroxyethyl bacteriochlorophyllide A dehydrogenase